MTSFEIDGSNEKDPTSGGSVSGIDDVPGLQDALDDKEDAFTTLSKSKGGFGASIAAVGNGVLKFVAGALTAVSQLGLADGGTGADLSGSGGSTHFLAQAADHTVSARAIAKTDMPFTGTPDGTKVLKDDQSWGSVSATDSTYLGTTGGTSTDLTVSASGFSLATGVRVRVKLHTTITGFPTTLNVGGTGAVALAREVAAGPLYLSSGQLHSGDILEATYDGTYWRVQSPWLINRSDFPNLALTPSDMPAEYRLEANCTSEDVGSGGGGQITKAYSTPGVNTGPAWSYAAGVWTCLIGGIYDVDAVIYGASSSKTEVQLRYNGSTIIAIGQAVAAEDYPQVHSSYRFGAGDTLEVRINTITGFTISASYAGVRELIIQRRCA